MKTRMQSLHSAGSDFGIDFAFFAKMREHFIRGMSYEAWDDLFDTQYQMKTDRGGEVVPTVLLRALARTHRTIRDARSRGLRYDEYEEEERTGRKLPSRQREIVFSESVTHHDGDYW